jgi:hypothetical protein
MKAIELENGMRVRCGKREGVVLGIRHRVSFQVKPDKGPPVSWFVDGERELDVVDQQECAP